MLHFHKFRCIYNGVGTKHLEYSTQRSLHMHWAGTHADRVMLFLFIYLFLQDCFSFSMLAWHLILDKSLNICQLKHEPVSLASSSSTRPHVTHICTEGDSSNCLTYKHLFYMITFCRINQFLLPNSSSLHSYLVQSISLQYSTPSTCGIYI